MLAVLGGNKGFGRGYERAKGHDPRETQVPQMLNEEQQLKFVREIRGHFLPLQNSFLRIQIVITGLRVTVTHLSYARKYKVKGITATGASVLRYGLKWLVVWLTRPFVSPLVLIVMVRCVQ